MPFNVILVALDGSSQARDVAALAARIVGHDTRNVHLVCAVDAGYMANLGQDSTVAQDGLAYPWAATEQHHAEAILACAALAFAVIGVTPTRQIISGTPAAAIVDEARRVSADLIVMGHRHLSTLGRFVNPSTAADVLEHARCPVLLDTTMHTPSAA